MFVPTDEARKARGVAEDLGQVDCGEAGVAAKWIVTDFDLTDMHPQIGVRSQPFGQVVQATLVREGEVTVEVGEGETLHLN
jgi:hypothetical protein